MLSNTSSYNSDIVINIGQIQSMLDEIEYMSNDEHHNIINILNKNNIKYMENENGIFCKLNQLPLNIIIDIYTYVEEIRNSRQNIETAIRSVETSNKNIEADAINKVNVEQEQKQASNIEVEQWKINIIEKMRCESKSRPKRKKSNKIQQPQHPLPTDKIDN